MQRYYYGLDAVRFLSALAVCFFHLGFYVWASNHSSMTGIFGGRASFDALTPVTWLGWVGVEIFFVVSGFVIANSANGATPFAFMQSRLVRLWPAAWICATITLAARLFAGEDFWRDLVSNYARSLVFWPKGGWIDGVYWSLAVEMTFYALIFALLLLHSFRKLPVLAWVLAMVSSAFIALGWYSEVGEASFGVLFETFTAQVDYLPIRHGVFFAIGIWLWMLANRSMTPLAWIGFILATGFGLAEIELRAWEIENIEALAAAGQPTLAPAIVWLLAMGFMIISTSEPERYTPRSEIFRAAMRLAGKITYPLYLLHSVVGAGSMRLLIDLGMTPYAALFSAIALVLVGATLIAVYLEPIAREPLRRGLSAAGGAAKRLRALRPLFREADAIPIKHG